MFDDIDIVCLFLLDTTIQSAFNYHLLSPVLSINMNLMNPTSINSRSTKTSLYPNRIKCGQAGKAMAVPTDLGGQIMHEIGWKCRNVPELFHLLSILPIADDHPILGLWVV